MRLDLHRSGPWIGIGGIFIQMFIAFPAFFTLMPGTEDRLNVSGAGIAVIVALWLIQVIAVVRLAKSRPVLCVYVPVAGLVAYFAVIVVGVRWLGWS